MLFLSLIAFTVSAAAALLLTPMLYDTAVASGILDMPGTRKVHRRPIPRLGGVAVFCAWFLALDVVGVLVGPARVSLVLQAVPVVLAAAASVLIGLWDDIQNLPGWKKLIGQVAIGLLLVALDLRVRQISHPLTGDPLLLPWWLSVAVTMAWVIGVMNAMNLIDGLDGLAAGIAAIAGCGLIVIGASMDNPVPITLFAALVGACVGFLRYNFPPARIFLGDSGSQFLGLVFSTAPLIGQPSKSVTAVALLVPLTALSVPIYDVVLAVVRRFRHRRSLFHPDKHHLHHRLLKIGLSHRQVVLVLYLATAYFSGIAVVFTFIPQPYALILLGTLLVGVVTGTQALRFVELRIHRHLRRTRGARRTGSRAHGASRHR